MDKEQLTTVQIGKDYIPILKELAKRDGRSMRKYIEVFIVERGKLAGILKKKSED